MPPPPKKNKRKDDKQGLKTLVVCVQRPFLGGLSLCLGEATFISPSPVFLLSFWCFLPSFRPPSPRFLLASQGETSHNNNNNRETVPEGPVSMAAWAEPAPPRGPLRETVSSRGPLSLSLRHAAAAVSRMVFLPNQAPITGRVTELPGAESC